MLAVSLPKMHRFIQINTYQRINRQDRLRDVVCRRKQREKNKKLRCRVEHSASVVLSWYFMTFLGDKQQINS